MSKLEKFKERVGNVKDKLGDLKENVKNKFQKEQEEIEQYNKEISDLEEQKKLEQDIAISKLYSDETVLELDTATNQKVLELEKNNQELELKLNELLKKSEVYKEIIKSRIDEFFLYKSSKQNEGFEDIGKFNEMLKGTKIIELAEIYGYNLQKLYGYYKEEFQNKQDKKIDLPTLQELENIGMGSSEDMLKTVNSNQKEINLVQKQIKINDNTINVLKGY